MSRSVRPERRFRPLIDKWLFFARMVKSRSLAQSHIQSGHVR
ncbi:RNA-binding S4 domain-containing protein, partial [Rhizobium ruizarguesonis]